MLELVLIKHIGNFLLFSTEIMQDLNNFGFIMIQIV